MAIENAVNYSLRVIEPVLDGRATVVEVKREAEERYTQQLQKSLRKTVWAGGCSSWYNTEGSDGKRWNAVTYPHSQAHFWYKCLFPVYRDWSYTARLPLLRRVSLRALTLHRVARAIRLTWGSR